MDVLCFTNTYANESVCVPLFEILRSLCGDTRMVVFEWYLQPHFRQIGDLIQQRKQLHTRMVKKHVDFIHDGPLYAGPMQTPFKIVIDWSKGKHEWLLFENSKRGFFAKEVCCSECLFIIPVTPMACIATGMPSRLVPLVDPPDPCARSPRIVCNRSAVAPCLRGPLSSRP